MINQVLTSFVSRLPSALVPERKRNLVTVAFLRAGKPALIWRQSLRRFLGNHFLNYLGLQQRTEEFTL